MSALPVHVNRGRAWYSIDLIWSCIFQLSTNCRTRASGRQCTAPLLEVSFFQMLGKLAHNLGTTEQLGKASSHVILVSKIPARSCARALARNLADAASSRCRAPLSHFCGR